LNKVSCLSAIYCFSHFHSHWHLIYYHRELHSSTFRCQINVSPLVNFSIFSQPPGPYLPPFINFTEIDFFTYPSFDVLSLLVLFTPNIQEKIAFFRTHFNFMLFDNQFSFFPSLYNHLKPFPKFRPPFILTPSFI